MAGQFVIGSIIVSVTIALHAAFVAAAIRGLTRIEKLLVRPPGFVAKTAIFIAATAWLMVSHFIGVWLWASSFVVLGAIDHLEPAVYYSLVTFTTLGYGDITLNEQWRILGAICAVNGLLLFGFSTALLVELIGWLLGMTRTGTIER